MTEELCGVARLHVLPQYLRIGAGTLHRPFSPPLEVWGAAALTPGTAHRAPAGATAQRAARTEQNWQYPGLALEDAI